MKAVLTPKVLESATVNISKTEREGLILMLNAITAANNALPPTAAKFVGKNLKKLERLSDRLFNGENEALEALEKEYVKHDDQGRMLFWDSIEKRTNSEGVEVTDEDVSAVNGIRAYHDKEKGMLIDTTSGLPVTKEKMQQGMRMWVEKEKMQEFLDKVKAVKEDVKSECHVEQISLDYLEEYRIAIPTKKTTPPQGNLDLDSFFEYLVIEGGAPSQNGKNN